MISTLDMTVAFSPGWKIIPNYARMEKNTCPQYMVGVENDSQRRTLIPLPIELVPVELDVRSQEEFSFSDVTDDQQEEPIVWPNAGRFCITHFEQRIAQFWRGSCAFFYEQLDKTREAQRHIVIPRTGKLVFFIFVTLIAVWLAGSVKRSDVDTSNSHPLWAKTRCEVGIQREKH